MPKTSLQRVREYRARKKALLNATKMSGATETCDIPTVASPQELVSTSAMEISAPKTVLQWMREYRAQKKSLLKAANASASTEIYDIPTVESPQEDTILPHRDFDAHANLQVRIKSSAGESGSIQPNKELRISQEERSEIAQDPEDGVSITRTAEELNIHSTMVQSIRVEELDHRLYAWYLERKANCKSTSNSMLSDKAVKINKELRGPADFKASRGWIWGFKKRHHIDRTHCHLSRRDPKAVNAEEFISRFAQRIEEDGIQYENVYSMKESNVLWNAHPLKTHVQGEGQSVKLNDDRVTVGFCANATGSHKHAPLFITMYESQSLMKLAEHKLPVIYKFHESTKVAQELFIDWYQNHFKPDVMEYQLQHGTCGKVILLLDDYTTYSFDILEQLEKDERFEIILLPPYTSHSIQPIDKLIPKTKKSYYDKMSRIAKSSNQIKDFCIDYDLKDCINLLHEAWSEIDDAVIRDAWRSLIKGIPKLDIEKEDIFEFHRREMEDSTNSDGEPVNGTVDWSLGHLTTNNGLKISEVKSLVNAVANEENISWAFRTLTLWSQEQPKTIELSMKCLQYYYKGIALFNGGQIV